MADRIRRVLVWGGWLRTAHWTMAAATLLLLLTGWLIAESPALAAAAVDVHYLGAGVLVFSLLLRLFIGFAGRGADRLENILLTDSELPAVRASLMFYLSLGRAPMPNWFAHNPLWKPLYLVLFAALVLATASGWLMPAYPLLWGIYLPSLHGWLAQSVAVIMLLHVFSVVLQDLKGGAADISAMVNGYRYFSIDSEPPTKPETAKVSIRLDDIGKP